MEIECVCPKCGEVFYKEVDMSDLAPDHSWRD